MSANTVPGLVFSPHAAPPQKGKLRHLRGVMRYLAPYRWRIAGAVVAICFTTVAVLGMGGALRYLVDHGIAEGNVQLLNRSYVLLLAVTLLLAVATYTRYFLVAWLGERVVADLRRDVFSHLVHMDVAFFETARTGELLSRLSTDTTLLQTVIGSTVGVALRNLLLLLGGGALLLSTSGRLTGYVALMLPLVVAPILLLGRRVRGLSRRSQEYVAQLNAEAGEVFSAIRTVQGMGTEREVAGHFSAHVQEAGVVALARVRLRAVLIAIVIALVFGSVMTVLWIGGHDVMSGRITAGDLSAFVFYAVIVAGAVGALSEAMADLQRAAGAAERISELLMLRASVVSPAESPPLVEAESCAVQLADVTFHYPTRPETPALQQVSLDVRPGEVVALVGPSGGGKTTLFQLLLRFYDPQSGAVYINGQDVRTLNLAEHRQRIGLVPQDPVIFSLSAMENIRLANPSASEEDIRAAARAAHALEFLERLPKGLHTPLGERGVTLSGGQRQRIAIARAIIRQPRLLLLDEATSALDAESEHLVQQALGSLMQERTTVVIAHRLSTVVGADRIVLMNEGRIEAMGTHRELLAASPLYARLAALQFEKKEAV